MIKEFLALINKYREADNNRTMLTKHFNSYSEEVMKTSEYLVTPFLWYTVSVSENAITNLSISRFHALEFYKFLLYQLRELHQLIKKGTKLSSHKYDHLQAKCEKSDFTLTSDEFEMLKTTYSAIEGDKSESLGSRYIKKKIKENMTISSKHKRESEVSRFYTLIGGKWWFQFKSSSFGLTRVFFHIQLTKQIGLKQIIDFNDSENSVLSLSNVYRVLNTNSEYIGTLLVPNRDIGNLHDYFKQCEHNNDVKIKEFSIITQKRRSTAFTLYRPDKGWQELPVNKRKSLHQTLYTNEDDMRLSNDQKNNMIQITDPVISKHWSFTEYPYPLEIIKLYCKSPDQFTYTQLPFDKILEKKEKRFSLAEIGILRYLINKKALEIGFTPWRLIYNHSVKDYCIKLPNIPLKRLVHFLNIIPYGETYFSDQQTYIWTRLSTELISWIKNDLEWTIIPVLRTHPISDLDFRWFESTGLHWIRPKVLQI